MTDRKNSLTSVGIDIGTTSCHLVFSRLSLVNQAGSTQIPRLVIGDRTVLYESPIFFTPLNADGSIDGASVARILLEQYSLAGYGSNDINCGAVIITGETARLRNAKQVLHEISSLAGDFVAASAGPELEAILAGRGSGALQHSRELSKTICNIDIGGGTTNIAVFRNGALVETSCLRIGARCFQFTKQGKVTGLTDAGKHAIESVAEINGTINGVTIDDTPTQDVLKCLAQYISDLIIDFVSPSQTSGTEHDLKTSGLLIGEAPTMPFTIDEYWFSGGVAEFMQTEANYLDSANSGPENSKKSNVVPDTERFKFLDFGWYLANALSESIRQRQLPHRISKNPIRATVLGAGSFTPSNSPATRSTPRLKRSLLREFLSYVRFRTSQIEPIRIKPRFHRF